MEHLTLEKRFSELTCRMMPAYGQEGSVQERREDEFGVDTSFVSVLQRLAMRMPYQARRAGSAYQCSSQLHTFRSSQQ